MTPELTLRKALMLLDRGDLERGEELLRSLLIDCNEPRLEVQASVVLGELLVETGRSAEARPLLQRVLTLAGDDDVLGFETRQASSLLRGME